MTYQMTLVTLIYMYTDNTELYYYSLLQRVKQVLQNVVEPVSDWMAVNRLKFNVV